MFKPNRTGILLSMLVFTSICLGQNAITTFDVQKILKQKRTVALLEEYTSSFDFIPLETNADCLMDIASQVEIDSIHIYVRDRSKRIHIFDRKGKFITRIEAKGKGPGEYNEVQQGFVLLDKEEKICIYDESQRKLLIYSTFGEFLSETIIDFHVNAITKVGPSTILMLTDALYSTHEDYELSFFDVDQLKVIKKLTIKAQNQMRGAAMYASPGFSNYHETALLKIPFCDTVFKITTDTCVPAIVFDIGAQSIPNHIYRNLQTLSKNRSNYIDISRPFETKNYIFLQINDRGKYSFAIYNKTSSKWELSEMPHKSKTGLIFRNDKEHIFKMIHCDGENYFSMIEAYEFIEWLAIDYPKISSTLDEGDNPVLLIAKMDQ